MSNQDQQQDAKTCEQDHENKQLEVYLIPLFHY